VSKGGGSRPVYFTVRLTPHGLGPEYAYRCAKDCEQLLRERAAAGLEVGVVQVHGSNQSPNSKAYTKRIREYAMRYADVEAARREAKRQRDAEREAKLRAHAEAVARERAEAQKRVEAHEEAVAREQATDQLKTVASFLGEDIEVL